MVHCVCTLWDSAVFRSKSKSYIHVGTERRLLMEHLRCVCQSAALLTELRIDGKPKFRKSACLLAGGVTA